MPVYEYICPTCQDRFELLRSMDQSAEDAFCPRGHPGARRLISVFATLTSEATGPACAMGDGSCAEAGACACGGACSCGA